MYDATVKLEELYYHYEENFFDICCENEKGEEVRIRYFILPGTQPNISVKQDRPLYNDTEVEFLIDFTVGMRK